MRYSIKSSTVCKTESCFRSVLYIHKRSEFLRKQLSLLWKKSNSFNVRVFKYPNDENPSDRVLIYPEANRHTIKISLSA